MRPQRPLTEKVPEFNMSFHDSAKLFLFSKHQNTPGPRIMRFLGLGKIRIK